MISFKITRYAFVLPDGSELSEFVKEHKFDMIEQALLMAECYGYAVGAWTKKYGQIPKIKIETDARVPEMFEWTLAEAAGFSMIHAKNEDINRWTERIM